MKLGDTLIVFGVPYNISKFEDHSRSADFGQVCLRECEININQELPFQLQLQTIEHEAKHIWQSRHNEEQEEEPCNDFCMLMDSLLRENAWLVKAYWDTFHKGKG